LSITHKSYYILISHAKEAKNASLGRKLNAISENENSSVCELSPYLASVENVAQLKDRGLVSRSHPRSKLEAATISCFVRSKIFFSAPLIALRAARKEERKHTHTHSSSTPWLGWVIIPVAAHTHSLTRTAFPVPAAVKTRHCILV